MTHEEIATLLDKADEHNKKSEFALAEKLANEILSSGPERKDDEARVLCFLGGCCTNAVRYEEALEYYQKALAAAVSASNQSLQAKALDSTAWVKLHQGEYDTALSTAQRSLALAEKAEAKEQQAWALSTIASAHSDIAQYSLSLDSYDRALTLAQEIGNKRMQLHILASIGIVHAYLADYPRAIDFYGHALALAEEESDESTIAVCLGNIGLVHYALADYPRALEHYSRALALAEGLKSNARSVGIIASIGLLYDKLSDYPRALNNLSRALTLFEETGQKDGFAVTLGNLGSTYDHLNDSAKAIEFFKRALVLCEEIGAQRPVGYWMHGIATVEHKLGNLDAAYKGFLDTLHHRREVLQSSEDVAGTLLELGRVLIEQGKTEEGLARLEEALGLAEALGEKKTAADTHKHLADAYAKQGDTAKAYEHITKHLTLDKEIFSEESKKSVEKFNMRIAIAEQEGKTEIEKMKREQTERELANTTLQLVAHTNRMAEFRESMREIVSKMPPSEATVKELRGKLKELSSEAIDWKKYDEQFKAAYPEFTKKLIEKNPELTPTELRICSLLRMNLRSIDIAKLLGLSERTVEGHRTHVRRKMKISNSEDLMVHLARM
jgi:tetratricopeptide (TPR) repeat protein/DNA-binding CsgD family transcriptional regulator